MGRNWKRNRKNKHTGKGKPRNQQQGGGDGKNDASQKKNSDPYQMLDHGNFKLEAFYAYQGIHDYRWTSTTTTTQPKLVLCETDEERQAERHRWLKSVKEILPAAFRIGRDVPQALRERLEHELDNYVGRKMKLVIEPRGGQKIIEAKGLTPEIKFIEPVRRLAYVPHGYQLSVDRGTLRRNAELRDFHDWLKTQTDAGFITRQETVSMIPPVVLNPESHHMVLDMAAAPGSKTSQLLEVVNLPANPGDIEPTGCVVANDSDVKRAYMLVHQIRRINSPAVFITSCDARWFPLLKKNRRKPTNNTDDTDEQQQQQQEEEGIFDRVLADVPCSGDGTSRKNPGVWRQFTPLNGYALHPLQLAIALRGAQATKVGGYLCYSTCSMNPIENEAVVAELLRSSEGSLQLVERNTAEFMPGLLARPGMTTWKNIAELKSNRQLKNESKKNNEKMQARRKQYEQQQQEQQETKEEQSDVDGSQEESEKDVAQSGEETTGSGDGTSTDGEKAEPAGSATTSPTYYGIRTPFEPSSMNMDELKKMIEFAGMVEYDSYDEVPEEMKKRVRSTCFPPTQDELSTMNLQYCMRILPHDMDTGGFFVALLKKVAPLNPRAKKRFEALQEQQRQQDAEDQAKKEAEHSSSGGRTAKKPRIDSPEKQVDKMDVDEGKEEEAQPDDNTKNDSQENPSKSTAQTEAAPAASDESQQKQKKKTKVDFDNFIPVPDDVMISLKEYYGLDDESFQRGQYMIRQKGDGKTLTFLTKTVKSKLIDRGIQDKVRTITSGVKGFVRNNKECETVYRLSQDGVHFVAPHMSKRKFSVNLDDFEKCLSAPTVQIADFGSEKFREEVRATTVGCFVVQLEGFENDYLQKLVICMWRCRSDTVNFLVPREEIEGLQSKIRSLRAANGTTTTADVEELKNESESATSST